MTEDIDAKIENLKLVFLAPHEEDLSVIDVARWLYNLTKVVLYLCEIHSSEEKVNKE